MLVVVCCCTVLGANDMKLVMSDAGCCVLLVHGAWCK